MSEYCEIYYYRPDFFCLGSITMRSIDIRIWNINFRFIYSFLTFFRTFSDISFFSHEMLVILREVFWCTVQCIRPNVHGYYIFLGVLHYSLSVYSRVSKAKWQSRERLYLFQFFLIISFISSLKISFKLDFTCSVKTSLNSSNFPSTAALNSAVLRVLVISK